MVSIAFTEQCHINVYAMYISIEYVQFVESRSARIFVGKSVIRDTEYLVLVSTCPIRDTAHHGALLVCCKRILMYDRAEQIKIVYDSILQSELSRRPLYSLNTDDLSNIDNIILSKIGLKEIVK